MMNYSVQKRIFVKTRNCFVNVKARQDGSSNGEEVELLTVKRLDE